MRESERERKERESERESERERRERESVRESKKDRVRKRNTLNFILCIQICCIKPKKWENKYLEWKSKRDSTLEEH